MKVNVLWSAEIIHGVRMDRFHGNFLSKEEALIAAENFRKSDLFKIKLSNSEIYFSIMTTEIGSFYFDFQKDFE